MARKIRRLNGSAVAAVRQIGDNPACVHFLDYRASETAQPGIPGFRAAVSDKVPAVIGQMHHAHPQTGKYPEEGKRLLQVFKMPGKRNGIGVKGKCQFSVAFRFQHLFRRRAAPQDFRKAVAEAGIIAQTLDEFRNGIVFNSGIDSDAVDTGFPDGILEILQVRSILEKIQKDIFFIAVAQFHSVQSLIDPPVIKINPDMRGRQKSVGFRDKSIGMKLQSVFQCFFIRTQNVQRRLPAAFGILFHVIVIIASHVSDPFFYQLSSALRSQGFQKVVL